MDKLLPNRRAITMAIMKSANLDATLTALKKNVGEESVARLLSAEIANLYKSITDSAFFLGMTVSRVLDEKSVRSEEDMKGAIEKLDTILSLQEAFLDGVRSVMKGNDDFTFDDIIKDLDLGSDSESGAAA
jgi:hypothetical protein